MDDPGNELLASASSHLAQMRYQRALADAQTALGEMESQSVRAAYKALAHELAGLAALRVGDLLLAEEHLKHALELHDETARVESGLGCQLGLAESAMRLGRLSQARHLARTALERARELGLPVWIARALYGLGWIEWNESQDQAAFDHLSSACHLLQDSAEAELLQRVRCSLAAVLITRGETGEARRILTEALEFYRQAGDSTQIARCLNNLAGIAYAEQDWNRAREYLLQSVDLETEIQDRADIGLSLYNLALVEIRSGTLKLARKCLNRSFQLAQENGDRSSEAAALIQLGVVCLLESSPAEALNYAQLSLGAIEGSSSAVSDSVRWYLPLIQLAAGQLEAAEHQWHHGTPAPPMDAVQELVDLLDFILSEKYNPVGGVDDGVRTIAAVWKAELADSSADMLN